MCVYFTWYSLQLLELFSSLLRFFFLSKNWIVFILSLFFYAHSIVLPFTHLQQILRDLLKIGFWVWNEKLSKCFFKFHWVVDFSLLASNYVQKKPLQTEPENLLQIWFETSFTNLWLILIQNPLLTQTTIQQYTKSDVIFENNRKSLDKRLLFWLVSQCIQ